MPLGSYLAIRAEKWEVKSFDLWQLISVSQCLPRCQTCSFMVEQVVLDPAHAASVAGAAIPALPELRCVGRLVLVVGAQVLRGR